MNEEIRNLSGDAEMLAALQNAAERGLGYDPENLRFWRTEDGSLYATAPTLVEPTARLVEIEYERGAGYIAAR
jgi:hypothetical protein